MRDTSFEVAGYRYTPIEFVKSKTWWTREKTYSPGEFPKFNSEPIESRVLPSGARRREVIAAFQLR